MAIMELMALVETLRNLAQRKSELDKEQFENFVQPIWEAFEKVHENYKTCFNEYVDYLSKEDFDVDKLIEKIKLDSINSLDLRNNLYSLIEHLPEPLSDSTSHVRRWFILSLLKYFDTRSSLEMAHDKATNRLTFKVDGLPNKIRFNILIQLSRRKENHELRRALTETLKALQYHYGEVVYYYHDIKKNMLA